MRDLAIVLLGIYPREMEIDVYTKTCTQVFTAAVFKQSKLETTQMSFSGWILTQSMVHPSHGLPLSNKDEQPLSTANNLAKSLENPVLYLDFINSTSFFFLSF